MNFPGKSIFTLLIVCVLIYYWRFAKLSLTNVNVLVEPNVYLEKPEAVQKRARCSPERRVKLIHARLPIRRNQNVNTTGLEESFCFWVDTSKTGIDRIVNEMNFATTKCDVVNKSFLKPNGQEIFTALASIPGSGNTWLRHLLEELTGIYTGGTGSNRLSMPVFSVGKQIHNVIAIKTHNLNGIRVNFTRAIIIVRDLFDAKLAETNRRLLHNKTGIVSELRFDKKSFVNQFLRVGKNIDNSYYIKWIRDFKGDLFVLFYENLKRDFLNSLTKLAAFLNWEISMKKLWCVQMNQEGSFHRPEKPEWASRKNLLNERIERTLSQWRKAIQNAVKNRKLNCATN